MRKTKKDLLKDIDELSKKLTQLADLNNAAFNEKAKVVLEYSDAKKEIKNCESKIKKMADDIAYMDWAKSATGDIQIKMQELLDATHGRKVEIISYGSDYTPQENRTILCPKITSENALIELSGFIDGMSKRPALESAQSVIDGCDR